MRTGTDADTGPAVARWPAIAATSVIQNAGHVTASGPPMRSNA
jgi:hypothetical protein